MVDVQNILEFINQEKEDLNNVKLLAKNLNKLTNHRKFVINTKLKTYDRLIEFINESKDNPPYYYKIVRLLKEGKSLSALKLYKEVTGLGLREAKAYVDSILYTLNK